jgi:cell division inhibitor SepF
MGFFDEIKKLTAPLDPDDSGDDFFEGAEEAPAEKPKISSAQATLESTFAAEPGGRPEPAEPKTPKDTQPSGGLFSSRRTAKVKPQRERTVEFGGNETKVILFSPRSFQEAGELVEHLQQNRSVVMTLDSVQNDTARRLLDFMSVITFALGGKITPVSAKAYFIAPANVDILPAQAAQAAQPETGGQEF